MTEVFVIQFGNVVPVTVVGVAATLDGAKEIAARHSRNAHGIDLNPNHWSYRGLMWAYRLNKYIYRIKRFVVEPVGE